jgi:hypothetical protein
MSCVFQRLCILPSLCLKSDGFIPVGFRASPAEGQVNEGESAALGV